MGGHEIRGVIHREQAMRTMAKVALFVSFLGACDSPQGEETANLEDVDTLAEDTAGLYEPEPGADVMGDSSERAAAQEGAGEGGAVMLTPDADDALPDWTTARLSETSSATQLVRVRGVRAGRHPEFDRLVFDFGGEGSGFPAYRLEHVDRPLHECGSGHEILPTGEAWLRLRMEPAAAHTEAGQALVGREPRALDMPRIVSLYRTCDFEGVVTFVLAMRGPGAFRAFELEEPRRLVVDVRRP